MAAKTIFPESGHLHEANKGVCGGGEGVREVGGIEVDGELVANLGSAVDALDEASPFPPAFERSMYGGGSSCTTPPSLCWMMMSGSSPQFHEDPTNG